MSTMTEQNKAIIRRFFDAWNGRQPDAFDALIAPDVVRHCEATPGVQARSLDQVKEFLRQDTAVFPDSIQTIKLLVAEADLVAACTTYEGTQQGPMGSFPPPLGRSNGWWLQFGRARNGQRDQRLDAIRREDTKLLVRTRRIAGIHLRGTLRHRSDKSIPAPRNGLNAAPERSALIEHATKRRDLNCKVAVFYHPAGPNRGGDLILRDDLTCPRDQHPENIQRAGAYLDGGVLPVTTSKQAASPPVEAKTLEQKNIGRSEHIHALSPADPRRGLPKQG